MCTGLSIKSNEGHNFFGRNMDLAYNFNQSVLVIPRNYINKSIVTGENFLCKYAIIGMGTIIDNHLAMADGMNEKGLGCAGLNFDGYACFAEKPVEGKDNITPYDFIYWVLANHETVEEVKEAIKGIELVSIPINEKTPVSMLHFMICDKSGKAIVVERTKEGIAVYDNPVGVMTNNPKFDWHLTNLNEYLYINPNHPKETMWSDEKLGALGIGAGTLGMPGDFSSVSRFVRIAYIRAHMPELKDDEAAITQFFNMLDYVKMVKGGVRTQDGLEDLTTYTACMDQQKGIYYYRNYYNNRINAVDMHKEDLDGNEIKKFPYVMKQDFNYQN